MMLLKLSGFPWLTLNDLRSLKITSISLTQWLDYRWFVMTNIILETDSYKTSHAWQYPRGTDYVSSYTVGY